MFPLQIKKAAEKGFAAIEMTLIAPLFMLLIVAAVDIRTSFKPTTSLLVSAEKVETLFLEVILTPQEVMDIIATAPIRNIGFDARRCYLHRGRWAKDASPYIKANTDGTNTG